MVDERLALTPPQELHWKKCENALIHFLERNSTQHCYCPRQTTRLKEVFLVDENQLDQAKTWLADSASLDHVMATWNGLVPAYESEDEP